MALAASQSNRSEKKNGLFLNGFSNILVTNMLSFSNKHACLLVSCPSPNKHTECTMPGKKKKIKLPMYAASFAMTYVPYPRTVRQSRVLFQVHVRFFFNVCFLTLPSRLQPQKLTVHSYIFIRKKKKKNERVFWQSFFNN